MLPLGADHGLSESRWAFQRAGGPFMGLNAMPPSPLFPYSLTSAVRF